MTTVMIKGPASTAIVIATAGIQGAYGWSCGCGEASALGFGLCDAVWMAKLHVDKYCPKLKG